MRNVDLSQLPIVFAKYPIVIAAWVFGSAKDGAMREGSDLDIGVLFATKPSWDERCDLSAAIEHHLAIGNLDLVVLNGASAILRFEALSGRRIYSTDVEAEATFQSLAAREYEHAMWMLERGLKWRQEAFLAQTDSKMVNG